MSFLQLCFRANLSSKDMFIQRHCTREGQALDEEFQLEWTSLVVKAFCVTSLNV